MGFLSRIAYVLLTGYILTYFSEWMFWSGRPTAETFLLEAIPSWFAYAFITFLFLTIASYFHVRTIWALFLAGALYGWMLEGILVQTMYDVFPVNISFTSLAWHSLISIMFGWYWLPRLMQQSRAVMACLIFGLGLGLWSIGWWLEPDIAVASIETVFFYNLVFGLPLGLVYLLQSRFSIANFKPSRIEVAGAIILLAITFVMITVPQQPLALFIFPPLALPVLWTLWKNRQHETGLQTTSNQITVRQALPLMLIPLTASLVYAFSLSIGFLFPGLQVVFVITTPLGFVMLAVSIYKTLKLGSHRSIYLVAEGRVS